MNKKVLLAAFVIGMGTAAFAATPTTIVYPTGDTSYVGPAGTSIGTFFTQTSSNTVTSGCQLDSSGYEKEPGNNLSSALNIPGLVLDTSTATTACNITGTPHATTNGTQMYAVENLNSAPPGTNYIVPIQITITPTSLAYPQNPLNLTVGVPLAADVPTINSTGVTNPITYSVTPALPAGLVLNTSTGAITGTPTTATATASYTLTASTVGADFNTYTTTATVGITVQAAANISAYAHSKVIKLNTTGFTLANPVTNYPLLVELNNANAPSTDNFNFSQTLPTGADIRFTTTRNNVLVNLPYEIEQWAPGTGTTGTAVVWVSVDTMYVSDSSHSITMYWGNALATSASSGAAVFSPYNGYQGVWHMSGSGGIGLPQTSTAAVTTEPDVTGNNLHMAAVGTGVTYTPGFIGLGTTNFDASDYLSASGTGATPTGFGPPVNTVGSVIDFPVLAAFTVSAWANPGSTATYADQAAILSKGNQDYQLQSDDNKWEWTQYSYYAKDATTSNYETYDNTQAANAIATGWHYVVGESVNGPGIKQNMQNIYLDGAAVSHTESTAGVGYDGAHTPRVNNLPVTIGDYPNGAGPNGATNWYAGGSGGILDEISVSNVTRSSDWVTLNFQTQCNSSAGAFTSGGGTGCTTTNPVVIPMAAAVPNPPTGATISATASGQETITWTAPTPNGTSAITSYEAVSVQDTSKHCTVAAPTLTCTVTGLTNTTSYSFTVVAINSAGASTPSAATASASNIFSFDTKTGFGLRMVGSTMMLNIPAVSGNLRVSVLDLWGRTVWSRTVAGDIGQLSWNGKSNGASASAGIYVLRIASENTVSNPAKAIQTTFVMQ